MNADIRSKWAAMVRSAPAIEPKRLKNPDTGHMCYIGLLCELHRQETGNGFWRDGWYEPAEGHGGAVYSLPRFVAEWAEIPLVAYPKVGQYQLDELAVGLRQSSKVPIPHHTPAEVADLIERYL